MPQLCSGAIPPDRQLPPRGARRSCVTLYWQNEQTPSLSPAWLADSQNSGCLNCSTHTCCTGLRLLAFSLLFCDLLSCSALFARDPNTDASFGISFMAKWSHSAKDFQEAFEGRKLPPIKSEGLFVTALEWKHTEGILPRDIIFEIRGRTLSCAQALRESMSRLKPGEAARIRLRRYDPEKKQWVTHRMEVLPVSIKEIMAEREKRTLKHKQTIYSLSSGEKFSGADIDAHNVDVIKSTVQWSTSLDQLLLNPVGPDGEDVTSGLHNLIVLNQALTVRDPVTFLQDKEANWRLVDDRVQQLNGDYKDIDFVAEGPAGDTIGFLDDETALTYREMWEQAKSRIAPRGARRGKR